ncbi:hypothetical protein U8607_08795 [Methylobacterium durans]|uniref:hypothetical protein n=1 Tax=Methylobacterium durans TaxID=2202825 RepID=UPI002AFFA823|nr:hypothetical protein [Methylobacterium durans]MEA1832179.1 hypothetical protein [Methylobacterium durans]
MARANHGRLNETVQRTLILKAELVAEHERSRELIRQAQALLDLPHPTPLASLRFSWERRLKP